jgi:hypothetical protein
MGEATTKLTRQLIPHQGHNLFLDLRIVEQAYQGLFQSFMQFGFLDLIRSFGLRLIHFSILRRDPSARRQTGGQRRALAARRRLCENADIARPAPPSPDARVRSQSQA